MKGKRYYLLALALMFIAIGCGSRDVIVSGVGDAENTAFSSTGRMFVTGGDNVYEITKNSSGGYNKKALYDGTGNFVGITQHGNRMYTICSKYKLGFSSLGIDLGVVFAGGGIQALASQLIGAFTDHVLLSMPLSDPAAKFKEIYKFTGMMLPNGMASDGKGHLFVADTAYLPMGQIVRLTISALNPDSIARQETVLTPANRVYSPNGMCIFNNSLYFTDFEAFVDGITMSALVKKVSLDTNGNPGTVKTLFKRAGGFIAPFSLFDDLAVASRSGRIGVGVADFSRGSLVFFEDCNTLVTSPAYETDIGYFANPSSVKLGQGPLFTDNDLIVTEKGLLFEKFSNYGNKVSRLKIQ